jgi:hypothetical protein
MTRSHKATRTDRPLPSKAGNGHAYIVALLILTVLTIYGRITAHDFSWWDDNTPLHQNPHFNPPTVRSILYYWQHPHMDLYIPVT